MIAAAWCGAALFAASLTYFGYFYLVRLGSPAEATAEALGPAALDVVLFSAFALHHSVFARSGAKAWIARRLPGGLERSLYVWLASLLFLAVCLLWQPLPGIAWHATGIARWILHAVQAAGVVLTLQSASRIDIWDLAGIRQARAGADRPETSGTSVPSADRSSTALEVAGPYRWLRHPIYLGWVLFVFGAPVMTASRLLFAAISTLYLVIAIPIEERSLSHEFGPAYGAYQRQVRWRLLPGVW